MAESVNAIKDGKIDAFTWVGGVPTPAITDLAATPGKKIKLIDHGDGAEGMRKKYGPIYVKNRILANGYPARRARRQRGRVEPAVVPATPTRSCLRDHQALSREEGRAGEGAQGRLLPRALQPDVGRLPIPFHPGAVRYFKERAWR